MLIPYIIKEKDFAPFKMKLLYNKIFQNLGTITVSKLEDFTLFPYKSFLSLGPKISLYFLIFLIFKKKKLFLFTYWASRALESIFSLFGQANSKIH